MRFINDSLICLHLKQMGLVNHDLLLVLGGDRDLRNGLSSAVFVRGVPRANYKVVNLWEYLDIATVVHDDDIVIVVVIILMNRRLFVVLLLTRGACLLCELLPILLSIAILFGMPFG